MRGSVRPSTAVCATEATSTTPAATTSSSSPESRTQGNLRSSCRRSAMGGSEAVDHPERGTGIIVILRREYGQVVGREHGRLWTMPAFPLDRGHEGVHERRVELRARPLP